MTRTLIQHENVTEVLHIMAGHGWATADSGDVESPTGWFAYMYNDANGRDDDSLVDAFETDLAEHGVSVEELRGGWVLYQDNYGFRAALHYFTERDARSQFEALDSEYGTWLDAVDEDETED